MPGKVILRNESQGFAQLLLGGRRGGEHQRHNGRLDLRPVFVIDLADTFLSLMESNINIS